MMPDENNVSLPDKLPLRDELLNFLNNARLPFAEHRSLVWLLLFTIGLDAASTIAFMSVLGPGAEQNPVVRLLSSSLGIVAGPPAGKLVQLGATFTLAAVTPRLTRFILSAVILMNLFAFVINMHVFFLA